jgi:uncharacterized protein (DUF2141 family)
MRYLVLLIFIYSCASIQPLDGGEKDVVPPKVLSVKPDSGSLNQNSDIFTFTFDEYVKTKNASQLLLISPSQKKAPTITVRKKTISIKLNDSLKANTTYTINFNGAIIDYNEGNPLEKYNYLFSTGSYIDSLKYRGYVTEIKTGNVCENCNVHLYSSQDDSTIIFNKPDYLSKTDKTGNFSFTNLPPKEFLVYVIKDENKNLTLDVNELVSLPVIINTREERKDTFSVFPYEIKTKNKPNLIPNGKPGVYQFAFKKPIDETLIQVHINDTASKFISNFQKDTFTTYFRSKSDSIEIIITLDTINYPFSRPNKTKNTVDYQTIISNNQIVFVSPNWLRKIDTSKIKLYQDSVLTQIKIDSITNHKVVFLGDISLSKSTNVLITKGFITDTFDNQSKSDTIIKASQTTENPKLVLDVQLSDSINYIVQLKLGTILINQRVITSSQTITYPNISPGSYMVTLIGDRNKNNNWDTGNPFIKLPPEVLINSSVFEMRLNWDKELIIKDL